MILYNYKHKKESKLRGKNDPSQEVDMYPDPNRHSRCSTPVQRDKHKKCYDSSSPYYVAPKVGHLEWNNYEMSSDERFKFQDGSMVNPRHHTSCLVPADPNAFRLGTSQSHRRPQSHTSLPANFRSSPMLTHKDLSKGEKEYLYSIAKVYSATQMIKLKQEQYNQLLAKEMDKGYHTEEEYRQYLRYIQMGRNRQYLRPNRVKSAPLMKMYEDNSRRPGQYPSSVQDDEKELDSTAKKDSRPQSEKESRSTSEKSSRQSTGNRSQRSAVSARSKVSVGSNTEKNATGRKSQQTSDRRETTARKSDKEESSDTSESVPSAADRRIHREGHDRPKSRAGHSADDVISNKQADSSEPDTTSKSESQADVTQAKDGPKDETKSETTQDEKSSEQSKTSDSESSENKAKNTTSSNDSDDENKSDQKQRRDSLSSDEMEGENKVNKDPDTIEY